MFVTDDRHPLDLLEKGHMDSIIRKAIRLGLHPVTAIQMCTINTAQYFRLDGLGAIAPGYRADISVFADMNNPRVEMVFKDGKLVAKDGQLIDKREKIKEHILENSIHIKNIHK